MSGLFCACCPECGEELHVDESGYGTCTNCAHVYLNRLGYLIPVEVPVDADADVADIDTEGVAVSSTDARSDARTDGSDRSVSAGSVSNDSVSDGSVSNGSVSTNGALR
jgi:hypothetical protein